MAFEGLSGEEFQEVQRGLLLLGWRADCRLTADDGCIIEEIARNALKLELAQTLTTDLVEQLALEAFQVLSFQISNVDERALMASGPYLESRYLSSLVPLIDEATLSFYRGYYTGALAILFIVLESYLRELSGWKAGSPVPGFRKLRDAVMKHTPSSERDEAQAILSAIYAHYDAVAPSRFLFNRHGLLHGLRGPNDIDRMNCTRMFLLFDIFCLAEGLSRGIVYNDAFLIRHTVYEKTLVLHSEQQLLRNNTPIQRQLSL